MLKPDAMGVYVVAFSLSRVLNVLHGSVVMMLFPRLVRLNADAEIPITVQAARTNARQTDTAGRHGS